MAKRLMSDAEMRRRQKLQGKIGRTTSTMGLTALGVTGAASLAAHKPGALKTIQKLPGLKTATPKGMESAALKSGIVSGGIGGVGGFNQASIYSAESRKRKQAIPVKKNLGMDMGYYGDEGTPVELDKIEVPIEKAWSPVASNFDSEASRRKRSKGYEAGLGAGSAGAAGGAGYAGVKGLKLKSPKHGKVAAGLAGASLAAAGGAAAVHHGRKKSWQTYEKRDATSAFGVDHSDNPNGQHRETEN